jgi:L-iditol 2-dehydrogenase
MLEPLGVGMYSVDLGEVKAGMSVGVFGCGPIGLAVIEMAKAAGAAKIYATDLASVPHRLAAAKAAGAITMTVDGGREGMAIYRAMGRGVDVSFEAAGEPAAVEAAIEAVKPGGTTVVIGIPSGDRISFTASTARRKDLTVKVAHRMKHTYPRSFALLTSGRVDVRSMVTHRMPLKEAVKAFEVAQKRQGIKVVLEC